MVTSKNRKWWGLTCGMTAAFLLFACAEPEQQAPQSYAGFEGMEEFDQPLTEIEDRAFSASTGLLTLELATGDVVILSRNATGQILVNGYVTTGETATTANLTTINITETTPGTNGAHTVIVDLYNGVFATGRSATRGIDVDLGTGTNALKFRGSASADYITCGADGISFNADNYRDIDITGTVVVTVSAGPGNDVVSGAAGRGTTGAYTTALTFYGGDGNDQLTGGSGGDTINGGAGIDTIKGGLGADTLNGDAGNDIFDEEALTNGGDTFNGGADTDTVTYANRTIAVTVTIEGTANDGQASETDDVEVDVEIVTGTDLADTITCGTNACTVNGGTGNDVITGGAGDDTLNGNDGNDTLTGGLGDDTLNGNAGNDTFDELDVTNGSDVFNGGTGTDTVDYSARTAALTVTMGDNTANDGLANEDDNVKSDVENLTGGTAADNITGNSLANVIDGAAANDTIDGAAGNDTITGGLGDDTLAGGLGNDTFLEGAVTSGADTINGNAGVDLVDYSSRTAVLTVTMGDDTANDGLASETDDIKDDVENLDCGSANDVVTGNDLNNQLFGGVGDDTLNGGDGDDTIDGGAGTNTIDCGASDGDIGFNGTTSNCEL